MFCIFPIYWNNFRFNRGIGKTKCSKYNFWKHQNVKYLSTCSLEWLINDFKMHNCQLAYHKSKHVIKFSQDVQRLPTCYLQLQIKRKHTHKVWYQLFLKFLYNNKLHKFTVEQFSQANGSKALSPQQDCPPPGLKCLLQHVWVLSL